MVQLFSLDYSAFGNGLSYLTLTAFIFDMFCTGLFEEVLMRGVVLQSMESAWCNKKNGILSSATISSILFGLVHLLNYENGYLVASATQVIFTTVTLPLCILGIRTIYKMFC